MKVCVILFVVGIAMAAARNVPETPDGLSNPEDDVGKRGIFTFPDDKKRSVDKPDWNYPDENAVWINEETGTGPKKNAVWRIWANNVTKGHFKF